LDGVAADVERVGADVLMHVTYVVPRQEPQLVVVGPKPLKDPKRVDAVVRALWLLEHPVQVGGPAVRHVPQGELLETLGRHQEGVKWVTGVMPKDHPLGKAVVCGALAYAWAVDPVPLTKFVQKLKGEAGLEAGDPASVLMQWWGREGGKVGRADRPRLDAMRRVLSAVYAHQGGRRLKKLQRNDVAVLYYQKRLKRA
jgi:hypothetical protein